MAAFPHLARPGLRPQPLSSSRQCFSATTRPPTRLLRPALARASTSEAENQPAAATAKEAVERGLEAFQSDPAAALQLFLRAEQLQPDGDEARAAAYNAACAHTRLRQWQPAVDAIKRAVNDHDLKLTVALNDPDLEPLRERREWLEALADMRGGINEQQFVQLRSEAKAPFRLTRIVFLGGLAVGAALGLFIITARLISALNGGEGAPDLQETAQNFGINAAAVAVLGFIVYRDLSGQKRDQAVILREEALGKLQVSLGGERVLPLAAFRGTTRPIIIAGTRTQLSRALAGAEPFQEALRQRGVSVVPVQVTGEDAGDKLRQLKAEFAGSGGGGTSKGFGGSGGGKALDKAAPVVASGLTSKDRKWQLKPFEEREWLQWLEEQKQAAGTTADCVYVQVQLDGTVRASGKGIPPWAKFVDDLPELDSVRTKFTDGIGR